jgi:hypothetical protein
MLGYRGPAQPSPTLGDALNAGYLYLEVRCLGCDTHQTVALDIVRRPKATPIHVLVTQKTQQINNAYDSCYRSAKEKQAHLSLEGFGVEGRSIVRWTRFEKRHCLFL